MITQCHSLKVSNINILILGCLISFVSNIVQFGIVRGYPLFQVSIFILFFCLVFKLRLKLYSLTIAPIFMVIFFAFLSFLINENLYNLLSYVFFSFSVLVLYIAGTRFEVCFLKRLALAFLLISFFIILISLFDFTFYRYQGLFDNPNGMGRFAAWTALLSMLVFSFFPKEVVSRKGQFFTSFVFFISIISLLASNSRLSLISLLGTALVVFILLFFRSLILMRMKNRSLVRILLYVSIFLFFLLVFYKLGFFDSVFYKIIETLERGDFTQGRVLRWELAIPYMSWFGRGHDVYQSTGLYEVHSNYVSQVLIFGWVSAASVYFLLFYMYLRSFLNWIATGHFGYLLSFSFFTFYFVYGIFETGFVILPIYLAILFLGFADKERVTKTSGVKYAG